MAQATTAERKSIFSLFNLIALIVLGVGVYITYLRFTGGLAAVTNLSDYNPWGIWISFDLLCGVALAAGGYVTSSAVYLFGMKITILRLDLQSSPAFWDMPLSFWRCNMMWAVPGVFPTP